MQTGRTLSLLPRWTVGAAWATLTTTARLSTPRHRTQQALILGAGWCGCPLYVCSVLVASITCCAAPNACIWLPCDPPLPSADVHTLCCGDDVGQLPKAHNPTVRQAPDGTYLLFYIGELEHREVNCTTTKANTNPKPNTSAPQQQPQLGWKPQTDVVQMAWATSLDGPWQNRVVIHAATPASNQTAWNCHCSNPSPTIFANGTIMLVYRGTPCTLPGPAWRNVRQGIAVAANWKSDFVQRPEPLHLASTSEDAFFWHSARGFHLVTHSWMTCGPPRGIAHPSTLAGSCGAYSYSRDSFTWVTAPVPFYQGNVSWSDGTTTTLPARQRPQILFGIDGRPLVLFNGVTAPVQGASKSRSWTMAVPFI